MAEEKLAFSIKIDGLQKELQTLGELENSLDGVTQSVKELNKAQTDVSKSLASNRKAQEALKETYKGSKRESASYKEQITALKDEEGKLIDKSRALSKESVRLRNTKQQLTLATRNLVKSEQAEAGSINDLSSRHNILAQRIRNTSTATKKGQKEVDKMTQEARELSDQLKKLESAYGSNARNVGNYQSALGGLKTGFVAITAGAVAAIAALRQIAQVVGESIQLAREQEKAEQRLETALGRTSKALLEQAKALQLQTTFGDEAIISQQAFLAGLGFTEKEIMKVIAASVDLATATEQTLEFAVRNLAKTYSGLTGELGELIPQLKDFTVEELKAGKAVEFAEKQFKGQAEAVAGGLGFFDQLSNTISDIKEDFGFLVFQVIKPFLPTIKQLSSDFKEFTDSLKEGGENAERFSESIEFITETTKLSFLPLRVLIKTITFLSENVFMPIIDVFRNINKESFFFKTVAFWAKFAFAPVNLLVGLFNALVESEPEKKIDEFNASLAQTVPTVEDFNKALEETFSLLGEAGDFTIFKTITNFKTLNDEIKKLKEEQAKLNLETVDGIKEWVEYSQKIEKLTVDIQNLKDTISRFSTDAEVPIRLKIQGIDVLNVEDGFKDAIKKAIEKVKVDLEEFKFADSILGDVFKFTDEDQEALLANTAFAVDTISQGINIISELSESATQKRIKDLEEQLDAGIITQEQFDNKREEIEKKAFQRQKKLQLALALAQGAQAIVSTLAAPPGGADIISLGVLRAIQVGLVAAATATQIGVIASAKFAEGGVIPDGGGVIKGNSHAQGGVKFFAGGGAMEAEGGEVIINKGIQKHPDLLSQLSDINAMVGGKPFYGTSTVFQSGGIIPPAPAIQSNVSTFDANLLKGIISEEIGSLQVTNNVTDTDFQLKQLQNIDIDTEI